ncbi:MAG: hypothetical protein IPF88_17980 [Candidatus Microthrix sp.]|nr:hypothetical protein [Candidatus Microthrix sp.]MBK6440389.1 hypothetical protein [Candidatus Microthrix sp.]
MGELLRLQGHLSEDDVADALAKQFGLEVADLRTSEPEPKAIAMVPGDLARRHGIVPFRSHGDQLVIVTAPTPGNGAAIQELTDAAGAIGLLVGVPDDIERVLTRSYSELTDAARHVQAFELTTQKNSTGLTSLTVDDNAPVVQLVSRAQRGSEIPGLGRPHRTGGRGDSRSVPYRWCTLGSPPGPRIARFAHDQPHQSAGAAQHRGAAPPSDGQFSIEVDGRPIDIRPSVVASLHGEKVRDATFDKTRSLIGLTDLGFSKRLRSPTSRS